MKESPFNVNPELAAMKQDVADRAFRIKMTGMMISIGLAAAGLALMFVLPGAGLGMAQPIMAGAMLVGSAVAGLVTLKETKKLEIDEQYLQTKMQGGNWWKGYREEVVEQGAEQVRSPAMQSTMPPRGQQHSK